MIARRASAIAQRPSAIARRASAIAIAAAIGVFGCAERAPTVPLRDGGTRDGRVVGGGGPLTGSTHTGGGTTPAGDCRARLLVIFDRSLSMEAVWEGESVIGPRWQVAANALEQAITPVASQLEVGAILFPSTTFMDLGACNPVDPIESQLSYRDGDAFLAAWTALWADPELMGSTPIDAAFDSADAALTGAGMETAVVLLTDGEPTCSGAVAATARAADWHARGIDTWVIGLPGAHGAALLDAIADAGGTGASVPVDDPTALTDGLTRIFGGAIDQACAP